MPLHTVEQGESIASIASKYGFSDWKKIYDLPENASLRQKRQHPEIIFPGDEVVIPDRVIGEYQRATEQKHKFKLKGPKPTKLKIIVKDEEDHPFANKPYTLTLDEKLIFKGTTNGEGLLEEEIPITAERGTLEIAGFTLPVRVSHLDPIDELTGVQARLHNLGYDCGSIDGDLSEKTVEAVKAFQEAVGLDPTGRVDETTKTKLKQKHGC